MILAGIGLDTLFLDMKKLGLLSTFLITVFPLIGSGQVSQFVRIPNATQCAADSKSPTESAFLYIDATNAGRIAYQIAAQKKYPQDDFVARAITAYKNRLAVLADGVLAKLTSGQWPLINSAGSELEQILKDCRSDLNCLPLKQKFFMIQNASPMAAVKSNAISKKPSQCLKVEELSALQSHLFFQGVTQNSLNTMAQQLDFIKAQKSCSDLAVVPSQDPSSLLQLDILSLRDDFQTRGFDIWASFKTYLSLAWRYTALPSDDAAFRQIFLNLSLEENMMLFSNGCKSLSRPECTSDFLTSYQIRRMMISVKDIDPLNMNSDEMRDRLFKPETEEGAFQTSFVSKLADNQWVSSFFKSLSSISWGMTAEIKKSTQFFQTLLNKKNSEQLIADLNQILETRGDDQSTLESFHYLCGESNLIGQPEFSFYSFDLENIEKFSKLDSNSNSAPAGVSLRIGQIVSFHKDLYKKLGSVCERANNLEQKQKYNFSKFSNYRPWFKRYLKKYSMFQALLDSEGASGPNVLAPTVANKENYLQLPSIMRDLPPLVFCSDAIDCTRTVFESMAHLNRIALSSRALLQNDIISPGLFNKAADKVACGLVNPWEAQDLVKKKLFMDMISSVLFGATRLPIYLDVGFKPGEVTSFKKLVEDGKIKFDVKVDKPKMLTSLALHLGSLIGVPCSVQISQTQMPAPNNDLPNYFFTGITGSACKGAEKGAMDLTGAMSIGESYKQSSPSGQSMCGSCSINFEQALETSWNQFVPFRFFARLLDSVVRYNNSKDDPSFPHADIVNLSYLSETFHKYGTIPEKCVAPLKRGLKCLNNMCESLITRDLESATQRKVVILDLEEDRQESRQENSVPGVSYRRAWVQMQGCDRKVPVPVTCARDGESYYLNTDRLSKNLYCGAASDESQGAAK